MLRKKTSAIKCNKNYNQKFEFMGWGVVGSRGGCNTRGFVFANILGSTFRDQFLEELFLIDYIFAQIQSTDQAPQDKNKIKALKSCHQRK